MIVTGVSWSKWRLAMSNKTMDQLRARTARLSRLCDLIETLTEPSRQKELVMVLWEHGFLSSGCAELLLEHYGLELA